MKNEIRIGSIIRNKLDSQTGILREMISETSNGAGPAGFGDWNIYQRSGVYRITNQYNEWELVPKDEQTAIQRYWSYCFQYGLNDAFDHLPQPALEFIVYGELSDDPEPAYDLLRMIAEMLTEAHV